MSAVSVLCASSGEWPGECSSTPLRLKRRAGAHTASSEGRGAEKPVTCE